MKRGIFFLALLLVTSAWSEDTLKVTDGKVKEPTMPPPSADRSERSKASAAAAAAGAAQGKIACMMMMKEALKEENPKDKVAMMMMASQQCNQATQMEIAAMENMKNTKTLSSADVPKPGSFTAGKTEIVKGKNDEKMLSFDEGAPSRGLTSGGDLPITPPNSPPIVADLGSKKDVVEATQAISAQPVGPPSPLAPIKPGSLEYDDAQKNPGAPMVASVGGGLGMGAGSSSAQTSKNQSDAAATAAAAEIDDNRPSRRSRAATNDAAGAGGGAGGDEGGRGGGDETFDALMAQLGGGPLPEPEFTEGGGTQLMTSSDSISPSDRANIFEYASLRFQKLTGDKRLGGKPETKAPERSLASVQP